jgi:hypothetical protein
MGYGPDTLARQLQDAAGLGADESAPLLSGLPNVLQAAGRGLTCFAVQHCCNNPACLNNAGPSEAQLVNGRGGLAKLKGGQAVAWCRFHPNTLGPAT